MRSAFALTLVVAVISCNIFPVTPTAINLKSTSIQIPGLNVKSPVVSQVHTGTEYLDNEQKYHLSWTVNTEEKTISFEVTAETKGYVGFGLSPNGAMTGADILIAGVKEDRSVYFTDFHGVGNTRPVEDKVANWNVTSGEENETHTKLKFHRLLNTCDEEDFIITDATMRIIWSLGETDDIAYHGTTQRGTKSVNFFLQGGDNFDPEKYQKLDITVNTTMPAEHTAYWCTIHELPLFAEKQHIVSFEPILENALALQHTHHFIFHRCIAPDGQDPEAFFKPWVSYEGDYCYGQQKNASFPFTEYCNGHMVYVWSKGGKRMVFPEHVGLPMPETPGQKEYYALEVHYDNPESTADLSFKTGGRIYYTSELRSQEAGLTLVGQDTYIPLTIPPKAENFVVSGHCSPDCTQKNLPEEGVTIFNNLLHAHLTGRKLKLRHFRGDEEFEWIDADDYYDFDYQQNKPLSKTRKLERGDQLTVECTFDTMAVEGGKAVIGGLSSKDEMCQAWFFYYPRQDFPKCSTSQTLEDHLAIFGITDFEKADSEYEGGQERIRILKPDNLAGDYLDSISFKVNWTSEFREHYQQVKRFGEQWASCGGKEESKGVGKYPENFKPYVPTNECQGPPPGDGDNNSAGVTTVSATLVALIFAFLLIINRI